MFINKHRAYATYHVSLNRCIGAHLKLTQKWGQLFKKIMHDWGEHLVFFYFNKLMKKTCFPL